MLGWRFSTFECAARPLNFMDMLMPNFINLPAFTEDGDETFTLSKSLLVGLTYPHD